ncbi:hypothetical protein [Luteimonas sp. TWI1416]|uniref:hypothetical protein n=1 Tax=unclassified Luteimonas TaxID=2629088 RepID=UPI0032084E3A
MPQDIEKEESTKGPKSISNLFSGSLSLTVLLTGILYVQGRMYHSGYLSALGLAESQFPIDTPQALFISLHGWISGSIKVFDSFDSAFLLDLARTGVFTLAAFVIGISLIFLTQRILTPERTAKISSWRDLFGRRRILAIYLSTIPATILSLLIIPALMMIGSFIIMLTFMILCTPFFSLGQEMARDACNGKRSTVGIAKITGSTSPLIMLECGTQFCALIKEDGQLVVISTELIERTDFLPVREAGPNDSILPRCRVQASG